MLYIRRIATAYLCVTNILTYLFVNNTERRAISLRQLLFSGCLIGSR